MVTQIKVRHVITIEQWSLYPHQWGDLSLEEVIEKLKGVDLTPLVELFGLDDDSGTIKHEIGIDVMKVE